MLQPEFLQELICFAKRQQYDEAEGFCDPDCYADVLADLSAEGFLQLKAFADDVAKAANVPREVATNAFVSMVTHKIAAALVSGKFDAGPDVRENFVAHLKAGRQTAN